MTAQAAESKAYGDFTYEEGENGITITKYTGESKKVVIPDKINGIEITGIGEYAFYGCNNLTSIMIPEGVTSIGSAAFSGCSSLTSITIPDSVTSINGEAFEECKSLTSITIPEGVTEIWRRTFADCSSLTNVTLPKSLTFIGAGVFLVVKV